MFAARSAIGILASVSYTAYAALSLMGYGSTSA